MLQFVSQSSDLPVTLAKLKAHLRIMAADDSQDDYFTDLIWEAADLIESRTGYSYCQATFDLVLPTFWVEPLRHTVYPQSPWGYWYPYWPVGAVPYSWIRNNRIYIPRPPLASLDSVTYFDSDNNQQTLDPSNYNVIQASYEPSFVEPTSFWPATAVRSDAVTIRFTSGTWTNQARFQRALLAVAGWLNENREGQAKDIEGIDRLILSLCDGGYR